jgi:hypothetical protein
VNKTRMGLFLVERRILAGHPLLECPRLILLLFGGIPNSPMDAKTCTVNSRSDQATIQVTEDLALKDTPGMSNWTRGKALYSTAL